MSDPYVRSVVAQMGYDIDSIPAFEPLYMSVKVLKDKVYPGRMMPDIIAMILALSLKEAPVVVSDAASETIDDDVEKVPDVIPDAGDAIKKPSFMDTLAERRGHNK